MRYVALLRGINVGKAKRIAMADLRRLFEKKLGFKDVRTLLNSGNVVFSLTGKPAKDLASTIETAIAGQLGVSSKVTVLHAAELQVIVADNPLLDVADNHSCLMVSVLASAEHRKKLQSLAERGWGAERLALGERVAYQWCPKGISESDLATAVAKALGEAVTTRNWATIMKLHALTASTG